MGLLDGRPRSHGIRARYRPRTAELFAAEGAQVTINDIDGDIAEQSAGEIQGETVSVAGDLTKPELRRGRPEDGRCVGRSTSS